MADTMISARNTHLALLRVGSETVQRLAEEIEEDEALSLLYLLLLIAESTEVLHDTDHGAKVLERSLQRAAAYGLVTFAMKHGTLYENPTTTQ